MDLGDVVLLPGLVDAHCHLDYTAMAGKLPRPRSFPDWIKAIVALKASWTEADFAASWQTGAGQLLRHGVTTVADVESFPALLPRLWYTTPLRVLSFREIISLRSAVPPAHLAEAIETEWLRLPDGAGRFGLAPHAPYTTSGPVLDEVARIAQRRGWRLMTHVAESEAEFEMFMYRQGPLYDWLKSQRDMADCGRGSPIAHLERFGYLDANLIAVHVNYLARDDARLLSRYGVHVVHCPRSHDYFRHLAFPRSELTAAGVNLCLGTDSLASVRASGKARPELSLFAEMALFARNHPDVAPSDILAMVTLNPARALGQTGIIGELAPDSYADLIVIPCRDGGDDPVSAVVAHEGPVSGVMVGGEWVVRPPGI
ncbi:MAG TPA: amidohydrolase family protein [Methylomirabilota bacterium]|nr:amidohydrolase family protein [Methylomirabilota bacterium]